MCKRTKQTIRICDTQVQYLGYQEVIKAAEIIEQNREVGSVKGRSH